MGLPVQEPLLVDSVCPCTVEPLTVGAAVLVGALGAGAVTTAVWAELAAFDPPLLAAVTTERIVWPTSLLASVYVLPVALLMSVQLLPELLQSCQA